MFFQSTHTLTMKFSNPVPIRELAEKLGAKLLGNADLMATGINEIHKVQAGDITFVDHEKYYDKALASAATIIIINKVVECPDGKALLVHPNAFEKYDSIAKKNRPFIPLSAKIADSAMIHPSVILEPNVIVGPHCTIGENSYIQANVTIHEYSKIGKNVVIQSGSVIGTDAFYFKKNQESYKKWRSCGRVVIENNVEIGASCTINKGVSGDTVIGEGSKFDCQIHIGHGVVVGKNCLFAAQVGIGGKTIVGDNVVLYGQVGIAQNLTIGDNVVVLAKSGVSKSLEGDKTYFGTPASEARQRYKELATLRRLPQIIADLMKK